MYYNEPPKGPMQFLQDFPFKKIRILYPFLFVFNTALIFYIIYKTFFAVNTWEGDEAEKKFKINKGATFTEVAEELKEKGLIQNEFIFKLAAKLTGKEDELVARKYLLKNGMTNYEMLDLLTNENLIQTIRFRVLEGYSIRRIGKLAEDKLMISPEKFAEETKNPKYIKELGLEGKITNLEGFLFPDTYIISIDTDEAELVKIMFGGFREKVLSNAALMDSIKARKTNLLEVVTLASIVEGETSIDKEKPIVAGVYLNRIKKNMRLEADPTVMYALPEPKQRLLFEDLKIDSPYNTYRNHGLPPGPINSPGLESIKAAINPGRHNFIFFVATGEGGHKFTENYQDHLKAANEYRQRMKEKRESSK